jgi:integral membrane sensor domain MASE1
MHSFCKLCRSPLPKETLDKIIITTILNEATAEIIVIPGCINCLVEANHRIKSGIAEAEDVCLSRKQMELDGKEEEN